MRKWIIAAIFAVPFGIQAHHLNNKIADTPAKSNADTLVVRQFDGTSLHVVCFGNTYESYCETLDGYTVVLDPIGMYEYAGRGKGGDLVPCGTPAKDEEQRTIKEMIAVKSLKKHLRYTGKKLKKIEEAENKANEPVIIKRYKHR